MSSQLQPRIPITVLRQIDSACDRFEEDWQNGRRPRIEDYVESIGANERLHLLAALQTLQQELILRPARTVGPGQLTVELPVTQSPAPLPADSVRAPHQPATSGQMLFEMLTGEWPFTGSAIEIMGRKSVCEAPSPLTLNANIPPQLAAVCHKLIAKKKEDRYATCAEVIAALEAVDLKAPVALEKHVEFDEAPQPLEFLQEPPAAPVWLKPTKDGQQGRKAPPILRSLEPLAK